VPEDLIHATLKRILEHGATLTRPEAAALLAAILDVDQFGSELRTAALLGALAARGETIDELAGFVDTLRARQTRLPLTPDEQAACVDTCGTGGDLSGTFNISTAAALVAAAAGATVAKHGNRAVTSRSGSADVLEALGIPVDLTPEQAAAALRTQRFAFLAAPALQPAMKAVMPIRRALGVRTAFNILGPMTNPAGASAQVLGVYAEHLVPTVANTLAKLNTRRAFVVHGGGLDEIALHAPTALAEVRGESVVFSSITPETFGLKPAPLESLAGGSAEDNCQILRAIFAGETGPPRDVVVLNAAAVLVVAGLAKDFFTAARLAEHTIDSGSVARLVATLSASSQRTLPQARSHQ
jgi:anthranilate phosphoribosyltransferase